MPFGLPRIRSVRRKEEDSDAHAQVCKATSLDPKCPTESQLKKIAEMTYHRPQFQQVMEAITIKLVGTDGDWQHIYKALILLEYCLRAGSRDVALHFRGQFYVIDVLERFQCVDEKHIDQGLHVRQLAKQTNDLLRNNERLRSQRRTHSLHLDPGEDRPTEEELIQQAIEQSRRTQQLSGGSNPAVRPIQIPELNLDLERDGDERLGFQPSYYQKKVLEATNNDPEGPSEEQMKKIARLTDTHQTMEYFLKVMEVIHMRLEAKGKKWRYVFKALLLLEYCLRSGSIDVANYFRHQEYLKHIESLRLFQYTDEGGKDKGALVRRLANNVYILLKDKDKLKRERRGRTLYPDSSEEDEGESGDEVRSPGPEMRKGEGSVDRSSDLNPTGATEEELLNRAIEESKAMANGTSGKSPIASASTSPITPSSTRHHLTDGQGDLDPKELDDLERAIQESRMMYDAAERERLQRESQREREQERNRQRELVPRTEKRGRIYPDVGISSNRTSPETLRFPLPTFEKTTLAPRPPISPSASTSARSRSGSSVVHSPSLSITNPDPGPSRHLSYSSSQTRPTSSHTASSPHHDEQSPIPRTEMTHFPAPEREHERPPVPSGSPTLMLPPRLDFEELEGEEELPPYSEM